MSYTYVHSSFRSVAIIVSYDRDRKVGWFLVACCFNVQRRPHWQSFIRSSHLARRFAVFPFFFNTLLVRLVTFYGVYYELPIYGYYIRARFCIYF